MPSVLELARSRISVRKFLREDVDLEDLYYAVEVARNAPSGANRQPWRFLIVRDPAVKREIRRVCEEAERRFHDNAPEWMREWFNEKGITWEKPFLEEAPVLVLVLAKVDEPYAVQSVWLAIGYMILALEERGLASLTYTPSDVTWIHDLLGVPRGYVLQAIIPVGKPGESHTKERLKLDEILFCEKWGAACRQSSGQSTEG
ncbi:MAG: nitroreductase family protein [Thermoproteota archaeon]